MCGRRQIAPLIEEYFFDQPDVQRTSLWRSTGLKPETRTETVVESVETELELSPSEQADLEELGRHFAQKTGRFGEAVEDSRAP